MKHSATIWAGSLVISCFARFWYQDNCGQSQYCGDCFVGHSFCVKRLKLCKAFWGRSASEYLCWDFFWVQPLQHIISLIAKANFADESNMDNIPSALGNRFSPVFMLIILFVNTFKGAFSQC